MPRDRDSYRLITTAALGRRYVTPNLGLQPWSGAQDYFVKDQLYATPYVLPEGGTVITLWCSGASNGGAKFALYYNTSDTVLYPGALLVDGGACIPSVEDFVRLSRALPNPGLYWLVVLRQTDSTPTVHFATRGSDVNAGTATLPMLGFKSDYSTAYCGFAASRSYASGFPPGYPTTGATRMSVLPATAIELGV